MEQTPNHAVPIYCIMGNQCMISIITIETTRDRSNLLENYRQEMQ